MNFDGSIIEDDIANILKGFFPIQEGKLLSSVIIKINFMNYIITLSH